MQALDVTREDAKLRERYGKGSSDPITDAAPDWNILVAQQFLHCAGIVPVGAPTPASRGEDGCPGLD